MAGQTARNWNSGDIITAANLNLIERGVSAMAEDYTPTTWANGNTVTAANLNNIEQGIAGGGGDSSDFSTAKVTFVNNSNFLVTINCAHIDDVDGLLSTTDIGGNHSLSLDGVLYKNAGTIAVHTGNEDPLTLAVEGNATVDGQFGAYTGDCTITITKIAFK